MKVRRIFLGLMLLLGLSYADASQCINLFQSKNYQKAIKIANSGLHWDKYDFNYNMCAAMSYLSLGKPKNAISYLKNAIKSANTRYQQEALYNYIGVSYDMMGDKVKALNNYIKAYKLAKDIGDSRGIVDNISNIAHIFYSEGHYNSAIKFYQKVLKQAQDSPTVLNNIALCYANLKDYKKALDYYAKSSDLFHQKRDSIHEGATYLNMGVLYLKLLDFKDAKTYLEKGISLANPNMYWSAVGYQYMGWYYDNKNDETKANFYYQKALNLARQAGAESLMKAIEQNMSQEVSYEH